MQELKPPICDQCKIEMSPAGGVIGKQTRTLYWKCWQCDTGVEDLEE